MRSNTILKTIRWSWDKLKQWFKESIEKTQIKVDLKEWGRKDDLIPGCQAQDLDSEVTAARLWK